jgi:ribosomal protein S18 acetylase RimI-like enzyme
MQDHTSRIDPLIVGTWVKGWTLARNTAPPEKQEDHFRVEVGWPQQRVRYVFPALTETFHRLAESIHEPNIHLKVCAKPEQVRNLLPSRWQIQPTGYVMTCEGTMEYATATLPEKYKLTAFKGLPVPIVKIETRTGEIVAIGRVVFVDDFAIYDRIETHPEHRRRGLATFIMKALESIGQQHRAKKGILVATEDGRALYEALGWQLYSEYTTAIIP